MKKEKSLVRKGILDLKPYIPGKPIEEVKRELGLEEVVKLASNETSIGSSPLALEAIKKEIDNIYLYPESSSRLLREKIAYKLNLNKEMIIVGNGADNIIDLVGMAFINEVDEVITGEITFPAYETITKIMGGKFISVKLKDFRFNLKEIAEKISEKTKLIFLCNPNNPTGTIVTKEEMTSFMEIIPPNVIVVFDEAYYDYIEDKNYTSGLSYVLKGKNVIVIHTFSKIAGIAGVRVGYGIARPELIRDLRRVVNPFTTNRLAQVAALASLDDEEHRRKVLKSNQEGKKYLYKELKELELFYLSTEANFIFIDLKEDSGVIFEKLLKKGVIIRPGKIYGCPNFIRVTIGTLNENRKFIQALKEVLNYQCSGGIKVRKLLTINEQKFMKTIILPYGKEKIPITIPQKNLLKVCLLKDTPGVEDNIKEIKEAIKNPIGSPTIPEITQGKRTAVVICTDTTRPTPDQLLIPPILDELNKGEISDENIKVIIALGQHRKMTEEEMKEKVGEKILKRVKVVQHDPDNNLFYLGKSKRGNELWVNKDVAQADVKISTGNIIPHRYAGYGGGAKSILPGVSSRETIGHNHLYVETGEAALGKIEGNPVREEMEEAAKMIGLDMIVNTVMNVKNEIVKVVAGNPAMAHQAGVKVCNDIYGVKIPEKADIILASSYPMDISFHQASKTLEAIGHIIKEKSTIIMLSPCYEGIGGKDFVDYLKEKTPEDIIKSIKAHKEKNVVSGVISYLIAKCKEKAKIYLISEGIQDKNIMEMGMLPAKSVQSVINDVLKKYGGKAKVLVLPTAPITLPLLEEE